MNKTTPKNTNKSFIPATKVSAKKQNPIKEKD